MFAIVWSLFFKTNVAEILLELITKDGIFQRDWLCCLGEHFWHLESYLKLVTFDPTTPLHSCVVGSRNGINPRDAELLKRAMLILRHFGHFLSAPRLSCGESGVSIHVSINGVQTAK